jgi:xanthine dehydrogenase accessory factor
MKEISGILKAFEQARAAGTSAALATVVQVEGSAYRRPGARMLITEDGKTTGGVSGGCLERDVILRARRALLSDEATLATYDTTDDDDIEFGVGLGCRGVVRVLIEPLPESGQFCHLELLSDLVRRREPAVLATAWRTGQRGRVGSRLLVSACGQRWDDIGDPHLVSLIEPDAREILRSGRSASRLYVETEVFLEFLRPAVPLVLFGGGPDAVPLAQFAKGLGWHVTVADGRPSAASRTRFPQVDEIHLCRPEHLREHVSLAPDSVAVVMTHNYITDLRLLEVLLPSPVRYLGLLGPKSRADRLLQDLQQLGTKPTEAQLRRLYAPVGLDLGAENAEEIALSILAEIRLVLAGRGGGQLRDRPVPIHERSHPEDAPGWETAPRINQFVCPM